MLPNPSQATWAAERWPPDYTIANSDYNFPFTSSTLRRRLPRLPLRAWHLYLTVGPVTKLLFDVYLCAQCPCKSPRCCLENCQGVKDYDLSKADEIGAMDGVLNLLDMSFQYGDKVELPVSSLMVATGAEWRLLPFDCCLFLNPQPTHCAGNVSRTTGKRSSL